MTYALKTTLKSFIVLLALVVMSSCMNDDQTISTHTYIIKVNLPANVEVVGNLADFKIDIRNTTTGAKQSVTTDASGQASYLGIAGVYDLEAIGAKKISFTKPNGDIEQQSIKLVGLNNNQMLTSSTVVGSEILIDLFIQIDGSGWVIKEIYFTGVSTPSGGSYNKDQFIELYNNTDAVMYADGISIAETIHNTQNNEINLYQSDIERNSYVNVVYTIPGTGEDVKVEPGKSILIAPQPIDHKEANPNSLDLSMSDYQWYDKTNITIDVPNVPNLERHYSYSATLWLLHTRGYFSLLIFRAPGSTADLVAENIDRRENAVGKEVVSIRISNQYILDAVELGSKNDFKTKAFSPSLDIGYTYCDGTNIGKSVRRHIDRIESDGRVVYKDTNNSAVDFIPNATPSPKKFVE